MGERQISTSILIMGNNSSKPKSGCSAQLGKCQIVDGQTYKPLAFGTGPGVNELHTQAECISTFSGNMEGQHAIGSCYNLKCKGPRQKCKGVQKCALKIRCSKTTDQSDHCRSCGKKWVGHWTFVEECSKGLCNGRDRSNARTKWGETCQTNHLKAYPWGTYGDASNIDHCTNNHLKDGRPGRRRMVVSPQSYASGGLLWAVLFLSMAFVIFARCWRRRTRSSRA